MDSNIIKKLPIPVCGLLLAILSLGNLLQVYSPYMRPVCGFIAVIIILSLLLKLILYPSVVKSDLSNPIILSNSGTFSMSLMLSSTYLASYSMSLAITIWILGIALHILLMIYFTYQNIIRNFDINGVYPSYWIVFVGITMAAITSKTYGMADIGFIFFLIGFMAMIVTLPLVIYRYIRYPNEIDANKPLICIFTALLSILIVGYLATAQTVSHGSLAIAYIIAFAFFVFALYKVFEYRNLQFYPSFSAFTFPFVITAIASTSVYAVTDSLILSYIIMIQTAIAVVLVIYVLYSYIKFLIL